jgi:acetyl-CoA C-acetyltransferase
MMGVNDDCSLDFAEVHDCFTIAELLLYEVIGLALRGQGARAIVHNMVGLAVANYVRVLEAV